jgi:LPXTG-site transpeptidase (sortase) family protein
MYKKVLNVFLVILVIAVVIAGGYLAYTYYDANKKVSDAEKFLDEEFDKLVIDVSEKQEEPPVEDPNQQQTGYYGGGNSNDGVPLKYKGFAVAGKLEIPKTGIRYPVLEETSSAKAIEISLVKIYGPKLNTPGNVVIAGHNNNNWMFFGRNKNLQIGDKVYITDMTGKKLEYTIYKKYYTPGDDYAYLSRETNGAIEVTLYTCDATGKNRLVICARAES